jgi:hypothetical protein
VSGDLLTQYAVGMRHVLVNDVPVQKDGDHTGVAASQLPITLRDEAGILHKPPAW